MINLQKTIRLFKQNDTKCLLLNELSIHVKFFHTAPYELWVEDGKTTILKTSYGQTVAALFPL